MKKFLFTILIFTLVFLVIIAASLLFIPNKKITDNSLYSNIDKHRRLDSLPSPKIIFVGGSNLAFGLDSKSIEEKTGLPVVNMGLHAGFGLRFTINEVKHAIKQGDIVIFSPVYQYFTSSDISYGEKVLVALCFDVDKQNLKYIDFGQAIHLISNTISYGISKLFPKNLDVMQGNGIGYEKVYKRNSFNEFGDENMHWDWQNMPIDTPKDTNQVNAEIYKRAIDFVVDFKNFVEKRGATFYIIPPPFRYSNSLINRNLISNLKTQFLQKNIYFTIPPQECNMADSLFFNTPYHLNKQGVDIYTEMIIQKIFNRQ